MFEIITNRLVHQIDQGGALIANPRQNDSEKLKPLAVVIKRLPVWFWQKTKYTPTHFTLNQLLHGELIQPVLEKTKFLKYNEKREGVFAGSLEAEITGFNLNSHGQGTSKFSSSLGMLCKEVVNMQKLMKDSKTSMVDLDHSLIQQTCGKRRMSFTIVVERIFTTCDCTIEYKGVEEGSCNAILKTLGICPVEVCLKETASLHHDRIIDIEIPPETVLAYSVLNMDIKSDGHYELSPWYDGFESDYEDANSSFYNEDLIDGLMELKEMHKGSSLIVLKKALSCAKGILCELTNLTAQSRSSLLLLLRQILPNQTLLSTLEDKLKDVFLMLQVDETHCLSQESKSEMIIDRFLDLLCDKSLPEQSHQNGAHTNPVNGSSSKLSDENGFHLAQSSQNGDSEKSAKLSKPVLTAMHLLVSAADGLTDDGLILLERLCSSNVLSGLKDLVNLLTDHSLPLPIDSLPNPLQNEEVFKMVEKLFSFSKVILKREGTFWAEAESSCEHLPLVLCMTILGLACLNEA